MELTKEHFDQQMAKLATAEELQNLAGEVEGLKEMMNQQTSVLDGIAKDVKDWNTEMIMMRARLDRHDQWFKQVAEHINIKLQS